VAKKNNPTYASHAYAKQACSINNKSNSKWYAARGIEYKFKTWQDLELEIGPRPQGTYLSRINKFKSFEIGNVKWENWKEINRSRRCTKFNKDQVTKIRDFYAKGYTVQELSTMNNCNKGRIAEIVHNKTWYE
jgi:hypothetical protein